MYFSLITPAHSRERTAAHDRAAGPYAEHQWLWKFFPAERGSPRDFLFRSADTPNGPKYYVVSGRAPQPVSTAWKVQTREYHPQLRVGQRLRFDLRANPVVAHARDGKPKRDDVVMQEKKRLLTERNLSRWQDWHGKDKPALYDVVQQACGAWLNARAERLGFVVDNRSLRVDGYRRHAEKHGDLRFSTVDFSGELTVLDSEALLKALCEGVGRAKAFGCGLMLVRHA